MHLFDTSRHRNAARILLHLCLLSEFTASCRGHPHASKGLYLRFLPEGRAPGRPCCVCNVTVRGAICVCRAKSKKHDQAHTMDATLAALEAPAPPPVICSPPAARQGTSQAPVEPLQPATSARVNSHKESDSGGMRTRSRAQRETSPGGRDTVSCTSRHLGARSEACQMPCKPARVNSYMSRTAAACARDPGHRGKHLQAEESR